MIYGDRIRLRHAEREDLPKEDAYVRIQTFERLRYVR